MAMLAERKRKQKWVILDRNVNKSNNWSKDSNKFGQKMLERMGWKEGRGLGRNEDGLTDYVKVAYKNNSKGVGFKDSVEWSAQQDNFNALLGELSNSNDGVKNKQQEIKSLELKSQNSRARVHYRKFTRGKDLSRYSEKDLANIFGKKKMGGASEDVQEETATDGGPLTISGGSMVDYFKNKMTFKFDKSNINDGLNDSEDEPVSFGFGFNSPTVSNGSSLNNICDEDSTRNGKKSKKKSKNTFVSYVAEENDDKETLKKRKGEDELEASNEVEHTPSKKKLKFESSETGKKSKKSKNDLAVGLVNPAFEPLNTKVAIKRHVLDTIVESDDENNLNESEIVTNENCSKIKKRKLKIDPQLNHVEVNTEQNADEEVKPKKNKKKNKFAVDNPSFNDSPTRTSEEQDVKRKKKTIKGLDNPALSDSSFDANESSSVLQNVNLESTHTTVDFEVKRKKKKKSRGLDNPTLNVLDSNLDFVEPQNEDTHIINGLQRQPTQNYEVKRKKKKSKGLDNPALNVDEINSNLGESQETQRKSLQNGIDNTALEISDCDIMLNVTDEPVKTTVAPKNKSKYVRFSKTNEEYRISARSPGDIDKRNELYDINTKVIQDGLRDLKKQKKLTSATYNFDIKSVDKIDFCDDGFSKFPRKSTKAGVDNRGFDVRAQTVEESVNLLTKNIDSYQAEVENGINESKMRKTVQHEFMVGELNNSDGENEVHEEGVKLRFKYAQFRKKEASWVSRNDASACFAKKSYKHLIRGDIILGFKKSNLHQVEGYAISNQK